ncbi:zinc finger B-box domain-containing protein 1 [Xenentodon cancila]
MNLNDFAILPNNKARSVKLSASDTQDLQMDTVMLAGESKEMEIKLQELRANMSKEKEERGHSRGFGWTSGHRISLNSNFLPKASKRTEANTIQKLSAGKLKIRVLKDEALTAPPQPPPPACPTGDKTTRRSRLRGMICGQCEVKTSGSVLVLNHGEETNVGVTEDVKRGLASLLLKGEYNEEESARSFQEALRQWKGEKSDEGGQPMTTDEWWTPGRSVSSMETQVDLSPDREAEGRIRGFGEEGVTVKVEFTENSLTYMERLLLKRHRRGLLEVAQA